MKVDKLFQVLVVGGGLMVGCGGAPATPPAAPATPEESASDAPAPDDTPEAAPEEAAPEEAAPEDAAPAEPAKKPAGACAWF